MNIPPDMVSWLNQLLFDHNREITKSEELSWMFDRFLHDLRPGCGVAVVLAIGLLLAALLIYRPRLSRGSFWIPAFGMFGGRPTLYLHTRPASYCGFFAHSRRLRHKRSVAARTIRWFQSRRNP